jgi:hypothetical protein
MYKITELDCHKLDHWLNYSYIVYCPSLGKSLAIFWAKEGLNHANN